MESITVQEWNTPQGGEVHYTGADVGAQNGRSFKQLSCSAIVCMKMILTSLTTEALLQI